MFSRSLLRQFPTALRRHISSTSALHSSAEPPKSFQQLVKDWSGRTAVSFRSKADEFTENTKSTLTRLGAGLNKVTGYEEIEALKKQVVEQEARISESRNAARQAKTAYNQAVLQRSKSQREVNDLLQRKSVWTDDDVSRFTTLVRQDHLFEQEESRAKQAVEETDTAVEREFSELMRTILARYHEEQVWSDKIRSASTYGQLAALGLNLLVFILAILLVEPWKRRRLAQTFEKKVDELGLQNNALVAENMAEIERRIAQQEALLLQLLESQESLLTSPNPPAVDHDSKLWLKFAPFAAMPLLQLLWSYLF